MLKTKIYIAGKITGDPNYKDKFANMESELLKMPGTVIINPAKLPQGLTPADYTRICFAMIDSSDIVVFAPDYKESSGALLEMQYCRYIKKAWTAFEEYIMQRQIEIILKYLRTGGELNDSNMSKMRTGSDE
ncbi:putative uncharacterized protein [Ruminococcus sp. CAG:563]|nr:putative uncharacterized protein [Ruminococcus sp. CAG:563]